MDWIIVIVLLIAISVIIAASVLLGKSKMPTRVILALGLSLLAAATILWWVLIDFLCIKGNYICINVIVGIGFFCGSVCIIAASLKSSRMNAPGISLGAGMFACLTAFCPIYLSSWWKNTIGSTLTISAFLLCLCLLLTGLLVVACSLFRLVRRNDLKRLD
jgi:hypothetical protein